MFLNLFSSAGAICNFFGRSIKNKTLPASFNGTSVSNLTTHATRVRISILKVIFDYKAVTWFWLIF